MAQPDNNGLHVYASEGITASPRGCVHFVRSMHQTGTFWKYSCQNFPHWFLTSGSCTSSRILLQLLQWLRLHEDEKTDSKVPTKGCWRCHTGRVRGICCPCEKTCEDQKHRIVTPPKFMQWLFVSGTTSYKLCKENKQQKRISQNHRTHCSYQSRDIAFTRICLLGFLENFWSLFCNRLTVAIFIWLHVTFDYGQQKATMYIEHCRVVLLQKAQKENFCRWTTKAFSRGTKNWNFERWQEKLLPNVFNFDTFWTRINRESLNVV